MAKSQSTSTKSKTKSTAAKTAAKKKTSTAASKAKSTKAKAKSTTKSAAAKTKGTTSKTAATATKKASVTKRRPFDQWLLTVPAWGFGIYMALILGVLSAGKYYLQSTLPNEFFTQATSDLYIYWVALLDVIYLSGVIGLVAAPAYGYYRRHGLRALGTAFVASFALLAVVLSFLGWYVDAQPAPEVQPQPQIQAQ